MGRGTGHQQDGLVQRLPQLVLVLRVAAQRRLLRRHLRILQIATDKDSIILDSFAGSGTTGHAVLKQNAEDGGTRKFILVEMEGEDREGHHGGAGAAGGGRLHEHEREG
jgi:hypothetical protein